MILKEHEKRENDKNSIINALNKTIFEVNHLKNTVQKFVEVVKYELWLESFISNIKQEIQRIIKQTSFVNMYSEMYDLFC